MGDENVSTGSEPRIASVSAAMVFNDMVNANVRDGDDARTQAIIKSGVIDRQVTWVAELRKRRVPIFWVRVERRADRRDRVDVLTDAFIARGQVAERALSRGPRANNIDELPIKPEDQEILKPRFSPFFGTDLDLQLRARGVRTVFLGGISTERGVEACARDGFDLDYSVVVLGDLCWSANTDQHEWSLTKTLPYFARVMTSTRALQLLD